MSKARLEAFSDGVIAIILTIMVLELKAPKEATVAALGELWPVWIAYALSYYNVFRLWLDHHELLAGVESVDRNALIANGVFLFCASLIPFVTAFAGESHWEAPVAVSLYGLVMAAVAFTLGRLRRALGQEAGRNFRLAAMFTVVAAVAWVHPKVGLLFFVAIPFGVRLARGKLL